MDHTQLDQNRQKLLAMIDSHPSYDLAGLSRVLGKNHAYLHQYIWKGSPRDLKERDWKTLLAALAGKLPDETTPDQVRIPQYSFRAGMGGGGLILNEDPVDHITLQKSYLERLHLASAELISIEVEGDSMSPSLESGDQVMINRKDRNPANGGIFAIHDSDALVVKRVEKIPATDPTMFKLISDNKNHGSYEVLASDTNIVGRVVWYARRI